MSIGPTRRPLNRSRSYQVRTVQRDQLACQIQKTLAANASKEDRDANKRLLTATTTSQRNGSFSSAIEIESNRPRHTNTIADELEHSHSMPRLVALARDHAYHHWRALVSRIHAYTTAAPRTDDVRSRRRFQPLASITIGSVDASAVPDVIVAARKTDSSSREGLFEVLHPFFFICHCLVKK